MATTFIATTVITNEEHSLQHAANVEAKVKELIAGGSDSPLDKVVNTALLKDHLGMDSMDLCGLAIDLEDTYLSIEHVSDDDIAAFITVQDVIDYVRKLVK